MLLLLTLMKPRLFNNAKRHLVSRQFYLFMHADAPFYIKCEHTVDEVNAAFNKLLSRSDALSWEEVLADFAQRGAFMHADNGVEFARRFLSIFGGRQLVHGHTPINSMRGKSHAPMSAL
jgi:hypothetical protein